MGNFWELCQQTVCSGVGVEGRDGPLLTKDVEDKRPPQTLADDPSHKESKESPKSTSWGSETRRVILMGLRVTSSEWDRPTASSLICDGKMWWHN